MTATMISSRSPAAGLTRPPAQPGRPVTGQPDRAEHREPRSGALDRPAARSYPARTHARVPSIPTPMSPEPGCVIHAQISEKDSDAGHSAATRSQIAPTVRHAIRISAATAVLDVLTASQHTWSSKARVKRAS